MSPFSDHDTCLLVGLVDLADGVDETGVAEREVSLNCEVPVLFDGRGHDFLKTRVDNVDFIGTSQLIDFALEAHKLEEFGLRFHLVLLGQAAGGDVIEVLQPFKVGAGDTSTVDEHVWGSNNASADEDLLSSVSGGAVSTLEDGFNVDELSVTHVQRFLSGGGDHAVGMLKEEGLGVAHFNLFGIGERCEGAVLDHVILNLLDIKASGVVDGRVVLNHSGNFTTVLLDELGGPVADSAEALDDEGLTLDTFGELYAFVE